MVTIADGDVELEFTPDNIAGKATIGGIGQPQVGFSGGIGQPQGLPLRFREMGWILRMIFPFQRIINNIFTNII